MNRTELANAALRCLGAQRISDVDTQRTVEAEVCRDVWTLTRDSLLRSHRWNFAKASATLAWTGEVWALPADCLRVLTANGRPMGMSGGMELFGNGLRGAVDSGGVSITYIRRMLNPQEWDSSFQLVFTYALAAAIAPGLSGASGKQQEMLGLAEGAIATAKEVNAIETAPLVLGAMPDWECAG